MHRYEDLIAIFNDCFAVTENTRLVCLGDEPLYIPANETIPFHQVGFANGFFSSALHECAHWLIAGPLRRQQIDYGYWYIPDGRTPEQQTLFQQVEIKPQALEWILSQAANYPFQFSLDNLNGIESSNESFKAAVKQQVFIYQTNGLSTRAELFRRKLSDFYS